MKTLLLTHAAATCAMTGLIWFVQLVHYPLLRFANVSGFAELAARHRSRTTWIVLPLMTAELVTAALLVWRLAPDARPPAIAGAALLALIWASTAFVQVPLHNRLAGGYDDGLIRSLVHTNWVRTLAWSARSGVALALLAR